MLVKKGFKNHAHRTGPTVCASMSSSVDSSTSVATRCSKPGWKFQSRALGIKTLLLWVSSHMVLLLFCVHLFTFLLHIWWFYTVFWCSESFSKKFTPYCSNISDSSLWSVISAKIAAHLFKWPQLVVLQFIWRGRYKKTVFTRRTVPQSVLSIRKAVRRGPFL